MGKLLEKYGFKGIRKEMKRMTAAEKETDDTEALSAAIADKVDLDELYKELHDEGRKLQVSGRVPGLHAAEHERSMKKLSNGNNKGV